MTTTLTILFVVLTLWLAVGLGRSVIRRRVAGEVELDLGPNPVADWKSARGFVCLFLFLGGVAGLFQEISSWTLSLTSAGALSLVVQIAHTCGRLQVCENGLWIYSDLVGWDQIASYEWSEENGSTLVLHVKPQRASKKSSVPLLPIPVPTDSRVRIEKALNEHGV